MIVAALELTNVARAAGCSVEYELRRRVRLQLYDESGMKPEGIAIYSLADPREVRLSRYVGQTAQPRARLMQHLRTARLSLPDETPWWVRTPQLRPLYSWIRELYAQEGRLPVMLVHSWVQPAEAHAVERDRIRSSLLQGLPLLNVALGAGRAAPIMPGVS